MILDIRYFNKGPEQIQNVRMITIYPHSDGIAHPEIVIHSYLRDVITPQININLHSIQTIIITND